MKNIHLKDVEYSFTPLGETLVEPLSLLAEWSEKNIIQLKDSQSPSSLSVDRKLDQTEVSCCFLS